MEDSKLLHPFVNFADADNHTTGKDKNGESEILTSSPLFYLFLGLMLICVIINSRITFVVLVYGRPTIRYVRKLVVQCSTISICYSILLFFEFIGKSKVKTIATATTGICWAFSYFRKVIYGIFPLNAAAFVYERFTGPSYSLGKNFEYMIILVIWMISVFFTIPEIFHVEYKAIPNTTIVQCTKVLLFDSLEVTVAYEFIRLLVFHVAPCIYMAVCVYKIRFKLEVILKLERNRRVTMQRRALRLLFVFLYTLAFTLLWLPTGIITLVLEIQSYNTSRLTEGNRDALAFPTLAKYILLCGTPIMYMLMNPDLPSIFPGCILYQGNILAERRRDWRRKASRVKKVAKECSDDIKLAMLGMERGEMGIYGSREIGSPVELQGEQVDCNERSTQRPLISPVCSIDEIEDLALVVRVKENPQTTLILN